MPAEYLRVLEDGRVLYRDREYPSDAPCQMGGTLTENSPQCFAVSVRHAFVCGLELPDYLSRPWDDDYNPFERGLALESSPRFQE